jgi:hypothetical protein
MDLPAIPISDHDERMKQARARALWELGDPSWAAVIINAYLNPEQDAEQLRNEREE